MADLGFESFVLLDKAEPEFGAFASFLFKGVKPELVALLGVCTGLIDYQLGEGGATRLWREVETIASSVHVATVDDVQRCMEVLLGRPVSMRYNEQKAARIARFLSSGVPDEIVESFDECVSNPVRLWKMIADAVGSLPDAKTIAFAMKAFDLVVFCSSKKYLEFHQQPPIAVDFHIRKISEILGLVQADASDDEIRQVWFRVSADVSQKTGKRISPLRIDSLIWQTGVLMYDPVLKRHSDSQLRRVESHFAKIGIGKASANGYLELLRSRFSS